MNNPCMSLGKAVGGFCWDVTDAAAGALLCKNKSARSLMYRVFVRLCDSDQSNSDSDHCKTRGYVDRERLMEASSTFRCQRDACCVKLLLAGVQTVSQRSLAAWGGEEGGGGERRKQTEDEH